MHTQSVSAAAFECAARIGVRIPAVDQGNVCGALAGHSLCLKTTSDTFVLLFQEVEGSIVAKRLRRASHDTKAVARKVSNFSLRIYKVPFNVRRAKLDL